VIFYISSGNRVFFRGHGDTNCFWVEGNSGHFFEQITGLGHVSNILQKQIGFFLLEKVKSFSSSKAFSLLFGSPFCFN